MHRLLLRQLQKQLGVSDELLRRLDEDGEKGVRELLGEVDARRLMRLLHDVQRVYRESDDTRRRLSHALRVSSGELYEANLTLERHAAEIELLHRVTLVARDAGSFRDVIRTCLGSVCELQRWPVGHAFRPADDGEELTSFGIWHFEPRKISAHTERLRRGREVTRFAPGDGIPGRILASREPLWFDDLSLDEALDPDGELARAGLRSGFGFPIVVNDETVAVLEFFCDRPQQADRHMLRLARNLESQVGQMLMRRRAERAQATQLGLLNATLESTPAGVLVVDARGRTVVTNDEFVHMWGVPQPLLASRDDSRLLAHAVGQVREPRAFLERIQQLVASPEAEASEEVLLLDGRVFERFTRPMRVRGRASGRIWVFRDVTAERNAERERARLEEQLLQSQKMEAIGKLAGGVAHDFNNLLTVILGHTQIVQDMLEPRSSLRDGLEQVRRAGERAAELTQQLLAFSRREMRAPKVIDLAATVRSMEDMLRRLLGEDLELVTRHGERPAVVKADAGQIEQVVLNLAINARDAMSHGGRLTLGTDVVRLAEDERRVADLPPGDYAVLTFADTGCGMTRETRRHVFEPFFTTKEEGKGTGLGLSTVYGIVRQSNGHIELESEPGLGTVFTIYLPWIDAELQPEPSLRGGDAVARGAGTVLIVEDEPMVRRLACDVLEMHGYRVLEASHGHEALRVAEEHTGPIDLVVSDVVMPRMNGVELCRRLRRLRPDLTVLFISGYARNVLGRAGSFPEGTDYLQKPFKPRELARKVREVLVRREA
jgi:signal transduction histidine kinase